MGGLGTLQGRVVRMAPVGTMALHAVDVSNLSVQMLDMSSGWSAYYRPQGRIIPERLLSPVHTWWHM